MTKRFKNRTDAGVQLADKLKRYKDATNTIILALPRGGVPVAYQVAKNLNLPMDLFIVRKLGFPGQEEYAMGAIAGNEVCVFNTQALILGNVKPEEVQSVIDNETKELVRRNELYRKGRPMPNLHTKKVILVDDGIATGSSIKAALLALEKFQPKEITLAVPVLPENSIKELEPLTNALIYLDAPKMFFSVGNWYEDFTQVSDNEVIQLLAQANMIQERRLGR